jgi:quinol monooxygenase YgiN
MATIVLARFRVQDYESWRQKFENNAEIRKAAGCLGTHIFYNAVDPGDVTVNFQWEDEDGARKFLGGPEAQKLRDEGGVVGGFDYWLVLDGGRTPN